MSERCSDVSLGTQPGDLALQLSNAGFRALPFVVKYARSRAGSLLIQASDVETKVLGPIVGTLPVAMVDALVLFERAPQNLRHDKSVLHDERYGRGLLAKSIENTEVLLGDRAARKSNVSLIGEPRWSPGPLAETFRAGGASPRGHACQAFSSKVLTSQHLTHDTKRVPALCLTVRIRAPKTSTRNGSPVAKHHSVFFVDQRGMRRERLKIESTPDSRREHAARLRRSNQAGLAAASKALPGQHFAQTRERVPPLGAAGEAPDATTHGGVPVRPWHALSRLIYERRVRRQIVNIFHCETLVTRQRKGQ